MRPIELSPRLRAVAELVPKDARFADVGTDHAYLTVWLLQQGVIDSAVVSDVRQGPLERARQTAQRYGLTPYMSFRLSNGLDKLGPGEADTIAIAGMGGETISAILAAAPKTRSWDCHFILQPMSALPELRAWLQPNGYRIDQEILCREGNTLYTVMLVSPGKMEPLTPAERWAGKQTSDQNAILRAELLAGLLSRAEKALDGIRKSLRPSDEPRRQELETVYVELQRMKEEWQEWQQL